MWFCLLPVPLQYANCTEVEAEDTAVIEALPFDFFCNCDQMGKADISLIHNWV